MSHRSKAALVLGAALLVALVLVGAVAGLAAPSAPAKFELTIDARHEPVPASADYPFGGRHTGRFTSRSPFCDAGSLVDRRIIVSGGGPVSNDRLFTCDDGTGTLLVSILNPIAEHDPPLQGSWRIVEGSGRYAGLRGTGRYRGEFLSGDAGDFLSVVFRSTWDGFADTDSVAPSIGFSSATLAKLRKPIGAYTLRLVLAIRDDVEGNPVGYAVVVRSNGLELNRRIGSTASPSLSMKLKLEPQNRKARAVQIEVTAIDPVGNESSATRSLRLPR